jgi:uncharacterized membrane protein YfcA
MAVCLVARASALGGMLGMASGIFIVPVLTMFGHVDIRSAIGASIVSRGLGSRLDADCASELISYPWE